MDAAVADYDEAIRLDPQYPEAYFNRAVVRSDQGDAAGAIADLEIGARLAPGDDDFPLLLAHLRRRTLRNLLGRLSTRTKIVAAGAALVALLLLIVAAVDIYE